MKLEHPILVSGFLKGLTLPEQPALDPNALGLANGRLVQRLQNGELRNIPLGLHPIGQLEWTTAGTFSWIVPAGVRWVSAVCIGAGGRGGNGGGYRIPGGGGGGGGATVYDTFAVTPGETLTLSVGGVSSTRGDNSFVRRPNLVLLEAGGGNPGSSGTTYLGPPSPGGAGGAVITGIGVVGTTGSTGGAGNESNPGGAGGTAGNVSGLGAGRIIPGVNATYGLGGGGRGSTNGGGIQTRGAIRMVWGDGRFYPSTNVQDM